MSVNCYANIVNGIRLNSKELIEKSKIKNPMFGTYKFDPNTGKKIQEYITSNISEILESIEDSLKGTRLGFFPTTDFDDIFVGVIGRQFEIGASCCEYSKLESQLTPEEIILLESLHNKFLQTNVVDIGIYSVGSCSY